MGPRILADLVVLLHLGFVLFAVLGGFLVLRWPRAAWLHLPAVGWAALVELAGWPCPLTPLENQLRSWAGAAGYAGGFLEHYLLALLYPAGLTRGVQTALGAAVIAINLAVYGWVWRRRGTVSDMAVERGESLPTWNDRLFRAIPLPPIGVAAGLALVFLGLLLVTVHATGDWAGVVERDTPWWQDRDVRLAILVGLLAAYLPAARRYEAVGARRTLDELRGSLRWRPGQLEAARRSIEKVDVRGRRIAGGLTLLTIPVTALLVDRDPGLYFRAYYWDAAHVWLYALAILATWNGGVLVHMIARHARCFADLARRVPDVDLLALAGFEPFMRQGLRSALPGLMLLSFLALNLGDRGFVWAIGVLSPLALVQMSLPLVPVLRGVHQRIGEARRSELARVDAAIRGESQTLPASPIEARAADASLGDLLAWRAFVESRSSWPFGGSIRLRLLLFVAIPLGSWLGGALVERLLAQVLD